MTLYFANCFKDRQSDEPQTGRFVVSENSNKAEIASKEISISSKNCDDGALGKILFSHTSTEDIANYSQEELKKAAILAGHALLKHKLNDTSILIEQNHVKRNGQYVTVITLVNDNKPFLLDSVMNVINEITKHIYLVAHPVFDVKKDANSTLIIHAETNEPINDQRAERISLMQIHIDHLEKAQIQNLEKNISLALTQVNVAVRDWQPMLAEVKNLIDDYQTDTQRQNAKNNHRVVEFLHWLMDNNFTFLGMRSYDFHKNKNPTQAFKPRDMELGILSDASIRILGDMRVEEAPREVLSFMESDDLLIVTKANSLSMVHRSVWLDYIGIKLFDKSGNLTGELRIVGLFTSTAYTSSVLKIPLLKEKSQRIIDRLGYNKSDHSGKALLNILESYPRDELFRADIDTLTQNASLILELGERPRLRVLTHADPFGRFVSILTYLPRDRYDMNVQSKIGTYFMKAFGGDFYEVMPLFLDGTLTRVYYVVHRKGSAAAPIIAREELEKNVDLLSQTWEDSVNAVAHLNNASPQQMALALKFPDSYRDIFSANNAVEDAAHILNLHEQKPLHVAFHHFEADGQNSASLKLFHRGNALALSERVPLLENMGFRVIAEQTLELKDHQDHAIFLHDMQLENAFNVAVDLSDGGLRLAQAFEAIWAGDADNDAFNALTQTARLNWRDIVILRHYGRYLQQAGIPYSQARLAKALNTYPAIACDLYALFRLKFDPSQKSNDNEKNEQDLQNRIETELQTVPSLDDDLIVRRYRNLIAASLRSNAFTPQQDGSPRRILATKLEPQKLDGLPDPKPYREIFVYGPEVEGVHLRFGPVARGGLRWSDRALDYRTEVLGLVKAQQVKNAVIVPVGSKGGFYPHRLPQTTDRAAIGEAARAAYIQYISAMLSITDNLVDGKIVPPKNIIRHDGDDPYFVVAADKGTATFSDTANAISQSYDFWLDDAFASGGSAGYDHKEMGITAKGAWEAVKRHFRELFNHDIQTSPFTTVGVGDMSGDVFGNGMLLSKQTQLIAAFDHRDIFIDPQPDLENSYLERKRLFDLPRSSWQDYDKNKISQGGGVFSRSLKTITLSPEAAKAIGFEKQTGTPFEIINAILKADVDLLWFGGIGTYVRATNETDAQVGDRANDVIRITGEDIRAKIIGEGANLGMTQRGRIEYAMQGGRCDTDAIDNSAGVNCSDVEVNIKIALASAMRSNKMSRSERNILLKKMTSQVSQLVLRNNYLQPLTLSLAEARGIADLPYQMRFINDLERHKLLDRNVEILPNDQALRERLAKGQGLTRPELAVIMAYAKLTLQEEITNSPLSEDNYFHDTLFGYFPIEMQNNFGQEISNHQLRRDIVATLLANDVINRGGPTFVNRLQDKTGQKVENVIRAYVAVRDGFNISELYDEIDAFDNKIAGQVQNSFYAKVTSMLFATTGWILRNIDVSTPLDALVSTIMDARQVIEKQLPQLIPDYLNHRLHGISEHYHVEGASKPLAHKLALLDVATIIPDISLVAQQSKSDLVKTAKIYFSLAQLFRIDRIDEASRTIPIVDYYDGMALVQAKDTIAENLRKIVMLVLKHHGTTQDPVKEWLHVEGAKIEDIINRMGALIEGDLNISRFTFAAGMLANLATKA